MNKRLLPLLGIAFVVAVVSTGIFYGLIAGKLKKASDAPAIPVVVATRGLGKGVVLDKSHVKVIALAEQPTGAFANPEGVLGLTVLQPIEEGQPVTSPSLTSRDSGAGLAQAIPAGLRAVSLRVTDSPGVLSMLHAGHRVDVQVVRNRNGPNGQEPELRTVLQNVDVLGVLPDASGKPSSVITVLARPSEADMLSLADAGARIRLILRNPTDQDKQLLANLTLAALFHNAPAAPGSPALQAVAATQTMRPASLGPAGSEPAGPQVQVRVRVLSASPAALEGLSAGLVTALRSDLLQVSAFRDGWDLDTAIQGLQSKRLIEVLSASNLLTGNNQEVSLRAGERGAALRGTTRVRIQFLPSVSAGGKLRLHVQPQITSKQGREVSTRKLETEVALVDGQSLLVSGLAEPPERTSFAARLFPGHAPSHADGELVVVATPQLVSPWRAERRDAALLKRP